MLLVPLGIYLVHKTHQRRWWLATGLLLMGALATKSRTAIVMLVVILVAMLILKPRQTRRMLPRLLPLLLVVHLALPGTIGSIKNAFLPSGGIVAQETSTETMWRVNYGRGRIGEWDPALKEWSRTPMFGQGAGTRVNDFQDPKFNSPITDDQWLASLLELGVVGVVALLLVLHRLDPPARAPGPPRRLRRRVAAGRARLGAGGLRVRDADLRRLQLRADDDARVPARRAGRRAAAPAAVRGAGVSTAELAPPASPAPAREPRRRPPPPPPPRTRACAAASSPGWSGSSRPRGSARRRGWSWRSSSRGCSARPTSASRPRSSSSPPWSSSSPTWPSAPRSSSARRSPTTTARRRSGPARPPAWPSPCWASRWPARSPTSTASRRSSR